MPDLSRHARAGEGARLRTAEAQLEEAIGLAEAIDLKVVKGGIVPLSAVRPATFLGKGKVEEIEGIVRTEEAGLVFIDTALSPVQQRNLEKAWNAKVVDRTGLILEIFGQRARTKEGTLQVELAHLTYQKSRLVRSWTHLERQRGGFGFLGGPGETQIEADRRQIEERIGRIERELDKVKRTRALHRENRRRVPHPIVALVGYTNAGKSTLFNQLTRASVRAEDLLFATLDPTLRGIKLPHGGRAILSDTVGFISELPTLLVAAFRATLEEVIEADVIAHVRDISHGEAEAQAEDVSQGACGSRDRSCGFAPRNRSLEQDRPARRGEPAADREHRRTQARGHASDPGIRIDRGGDGRISRRDRSAYQRRQADAARLIIDPADGAGLGWLHRQCEVLERRLDERGRMAVTVRVDPDKVEQVRRKFPSARPS